MLVKQVGMGLKSYFRDSFNVFDCAVVVFGVIDLILLFALGQGGTNGAISALRAFRLLRVFKLAKSWKEFKEFLQTIGNTIKDISNFSLLLFLLIFTYTLLGMEMFAYKVRVNERGELDDDGYYPDRNFNKFMNSFTTVFSILA